MPRSVRDRANLLYGTAVVNFDGVDDGGGAVVFEHRPGPVGRAVAESLGVRRSRFLPVVVDGIALAKGAAQCITVMRGNWGTTGIVHTPRDTAERLALTGVREVAGAVATVLR